MTSARTQPLVERLGHRLRAVANGVVAMDSLDAVVRTASGATPQYLVPRADVRHHLLPGAAVTEAVDVPGYVAVAWSSADRWYAEDDEVIGHARDPRHRADALRSSRYVEVLLGGVVVAASDRPVILIETDAPPRYFVPRVHVSCDLRRSETVTTSPYLGVATHWSTSVAGAPFDVALSYDSPRPEVAVLEHLIAFDDHVVEIRVSEPHQDGDDDDRTTR